MRSMVVFSNLVPCVKLEILPQFAQLAKLCIICVTKFVMRVNAVSAAVGTTTKRALGMQRNESATGFEWSAGFQPVAEIFSNLHANEWCEIVMNYVMESYVCMSACVGVHMCACRTAVYKDNKDYEF